MVTKEGVANVGVTIASLGLGAAMIPEILAIARDRQKIFGLDIVYLWLRALFFALLAVSSFVVWHATHTGTLLTFVALSTWYCVCYTTFIGFHYTTKATKATKASKATKATK